MARFCRRVGLVIDLLVLRAAPIVPRSDPSTVRDDEIVDPNRSNAPRGVLDADDDFDGLPGD